MLKRWLVAMMARTKLLIMVAFCFTLFLYNPDCRTRGNQHQQILLKKTMDDMKYQALLQEREEQHHHYTASLRKQIFHLKYALREKRLLQKEETHNSHSELEVFLHKQLHRMKSQVGVTIPNEFAAVPYESFTLHNVYQLDTGLTKHLRKTLRRDMAGALEAALHILNGPKDKDDPRFRKTYSPHDFFEGIFHSERDKGSLYDLTFRDNTSLDFRRLELFRPFAPLQNVKEEIIDTSRMLINIIVPLATRVDTFQQFMNNFREICVKDERIHLTVVNFGTEKINQVRRIIETAARRVRSRNFTLIHLDEKFTRGRALNIGARAWKKSNVLLFFCDVDVHFTVDFLNSCRINSQPGKRVFYPIPFKKYNPDVIYGDHTPTLEKQQVINKSTGFWRELGFGITCQYLSDFINIGGFDVTNKYTGEEDLHLYRKYLHSNLMVVRAPSRELFHMWHKTPCAENLPTESFNECIQTRAMNEASHSQMGKLFFHQQIDNHLHKYNQTETQ
ncbi:chondroitin sulfate N-acetylgalactosaminyltransferase 1 [Ictalurus punctatus]|uniref:Hexosyltransferase n=1 Tax=Ictalurus punctatus TaxID=7998 RepID=A0A2D0QZ97_ICTPU|nr:chondroitin sulfate N-acetylgalactosaminyltransferase 1 [Ictalurus punctatus]